MTSLPRPDVPLDAATITSVVTATADAVGAHYVFPDVATRVVELLLRRDREGAYAAGTTAAELGAAVTDDLQSVNGDRHLRLKHHVDGVVDEADEAAFMESYTAFARSQGDGVRQVRRLPGNVAYLELAPQLFHPSVAGDALAAAMRLVASAEGLVIDLRDCVGGSPETVALLCTYLFEEETHLTDQLTNDPADLQQRWTMPWVPGPRVAAAVSVRVLVSAQTFSGGEDLAYTLQQSGRARLVGETTRGGAHPRRGFKVHPYLEATVPVAYSRNAVSGTNWEGVGVVPEVAVSAGSALDEALRDLSFGASAGEGWGEGLDAAEGAGKSAGAGAGAGEGAGERVGSRA